MNTLETSRIAIVEDDASVRHSLERLLGYEGAEIHSFQSAEGYEARSGERFNCLLLDVQLDGISGVELCSRMRERGEMTPTIFITAQPHLAECMKSDSEDDSITVLAKPVDPDELIHAISVALGGEDGKPNGRGEERESKCV